ncbi:MAG TPA: glycosyl transferase family 2, partial [Verrucomicrobiales bacterium]|nr:glycosyl transferase family 2 [Verrucomicrobiales bacterium]
TTATIVGGRVRIVDAAGAPVASWQRYERWINEHLDAVSIRALRFVESPLVNPSTMASRAVYEAGFREGDFPEDYDFWLRAFAAGHQAVKVPEVVLDWTDGETRLTRTHPRYSAEAFDRCRREHLLACPLRGVKQVDLWGAGQTGKPWLRWLQETGFEVRRLVDVAPAKIGELIHGVKVIEPGALPPPDGTPMIVAVGAEGARELITAHLEPLGYRIGKEVWFVA